MFRREMKIIGGQLFEIFENQNFLISIFFKNFFFYYFIKIIELKRSDKYIMIKNTSFT